MYKNDWGSGNYTYNIDWGVQYLRESLLNVTPAVISTIFILYYKISPGYFFSSSSSTPEVFTSDLFSCTAYAGGSGGWGESSAFLSFPYPIILLVLSQVAP